jgi:hypothetical protein
VSRHWKPDGDLSRIIPAREHAKKRWPEGATAGLALVAAACLGVAVALYQVAGPRDVFEEPSD